MPNDSVLHETRPLPVRELARLVGWPLVLAPLPSLRRTLGASFPEAAMRERISWSMRTGATPLLRALVPGAFVGVTLLPFLTARTTVPGIEGMLAFSLALLLSSLLGTYVSLLAFMVLPRPKALMPFPSVSRRTGLLALDSLLGEDCFELAARASAAGLSLDEQARLGSLCDRLAQGPDEERPALQAEALALAARMGGKAAGGRPALEGGGRTRGIMDALGHAGIAPPRAGRDMQERERSA